MTSGEKCNILDVLDYNTFSINHSKDFANKLGLVNEVELAKYSEAALKQKPNIQRNHTYWASA